MAFRPPLSAVLALLWLPALAASCGEVASAGERASYRSAGRMVNLRIEPDRVGLIFAARAKGGDPTEALPLLPPGAEYLPRKADGAGLGGLLRLVDPADTPDRDGLADVAHRMLALNAGTVRHAGTIVRFDGSDEPALMTDEVVVQFRESATEAEIAAVLSRHGWKLGERSAYVKNLVLVTTPPESQDDALEVCEKLDGHPLVRFAEPNFVHAVTYLSSGGLDDPLLPEQWHHDNDGTHGSFDADIDSVKAWEITRGSPDVVIAVLEDGFDTTHPDLVPNLWSSPEDPSVHGWNFQDDDASLFGDPYDPGATAHGTAVAGCAGARGDNGIGVSGSCPECSLMLLRRRSPTDYFHDAEAISFAWTNGADVITNSWTYAENAPVPQVVRQAIEAASTQGRDGKGAVVLFAARNEDVDVEAIHDIASVEHVLTVGSVTDTDVRTRACGSGPCLDVLGPSRLASAPNFTEGECNVVTTDWCGASTGYNHDEAVIPEKDDGWPPCKDLEGQSDYTACFGGTSAATPIVAGVVGLVLSVAPELERAEIHRLLCDTADRVQDSKADYDPATGKSTPCSHGFGRVNAFEAVRVVAPTALGGRGGVDLFLRDQELDWGNTEQRSSLVFETERRTSGPWKSPDLRVDAPNFAPLPATSKAFDELPDERPLPGAENRLLVRVRNRGPRTSGPVRAIVLWTESAAVLPPLPADFWSEEGPAAAVPAEGAPGTWRSLGTQEFAGVPYSSGAGLVLGGAAEPAFLSFDFVAPGDGEPGAGQMAFLVLVDGDDDPAGGDAEGTLDPLELVSLDNNATLANRPVTSAGVPALVTLRNPSSQAIQARVELELEGVTNVHIDELNPGQGFALVGGFPLAAGEGMPLEVRLEGPPGTAELRLFAGDALIGGMTLVLAPSP